MCEFFKKEKVEVERKFGYVRGVSMWEYVVRLFGFRSDKLEKKKKFGCVIKLWYVLISVFGFSFYFVVFVMENFINFFLYFKLMYFIICYILYVFYFIWILYFFFVV